MAKEHHNGLDNTPYSDAAGRPRPKKARSAFLLAIVVFFVLAIVAGLFAWPKVMTDPTPNGPVETPRSNPTI